MAIHGPRATKPLSGIQASRSGYQLVDNADGTSPQHMSPRPSVRAIVAGLSACLLVCLCLAFVWSGAGAGLAPALPGSGAPDQAAAASCPCPTSDDVPQYFRTSPELWAGPTATGRAAFLAQTVRFASTGAFVPNAPLQTAVPVEGMGKGDESIFKMMGWVFNCFGFEVLDRVWLIWGQILVAVLAFSWVWRR